MVSFPPSIKKLHQTMAKILLFTRYLFYSGLKGLQDSTRIGYLLKASLNSPMYRLKSQGSPIWGRPQRHSSFLRYHWNRQPFIGFNGIGISGNLRSSNYHQSGRKSQFRDSGRFEYERAHPIGSIVFSLSPPQRALFRQLENAATAVCVRPGQRTKTSNF